MPSDTKSGCICGRNYSMTDDHHALDCPAGINYAAWIKPETDTAVDHGVEGVREAMKLVREIAHRYNNGSRRVEDIGVSAWPWMHEADRMLRLAAKPIAGMDAGEVEDGN